MSKHKRTNHNLLEVEFNNIFENDDYELEEIPKIEKPSVFVEVKDCERLNVRKFPNTNADILQVVTVGEELKLIDNSVDGWFQIVTSKNINGFVMSNYIKEI